MLLTRGQMMKHDDVLVNGFRGTDFCKKVKENIGRSHGTNELHFQTHTTFSSSAELTLRPLTFGPPPPAALPIHPTNAMVYATTSEDQPSNSIPRIKEEVTDSEDKSQSGTVPTISNGFIRDVSNAWLHTLADLCDWRSKHDKTPPDVNNQESALTLPTGQGYDRVYNERENGLCRKGPNGSPGNGSTPRSDYMISTILAGSSSSECSHDAMVTGNGQVCQLTSDVSRNMDASGCGGNSTDVFGDSSDISSMEQLQIRRNIPEATSSRSGENTASQDTQTLDASISSIPTRNLPPRKRHMRAMASPPNVQASPANPNITCFSLRSSPPSEPYQPAASNQSGYLLSAPQQIDVQSKLLLSSDLESSLNASQRKRKDIPQTLNASQPSKRQAVERISSSARDSPSSLESFASSNSDNSNRSSPFLTNPSTPDSGNCTGNSSGYSSRSGEPSPCQPIFNQSAIQSRLPPQFPPQLTLPNNVAMSTPSAILQRPGDLQAQVTFQQTTRYSISQEMLAQYNGHMPSAPSIQHTPCAFTGLLSNPQLNQVASTELRPEFTSQVIYPQTNVQDPRGPIVPTTQTPTVGGKTLRPIPLHYQNGLQNTFTPHLDQSQPRHPMPPLHDQPPRVGPLPPQAIAQPALPQFTTPPVRTTWVPTTSTTQGLVNGFTGSSQEPRQHQNQAITSVTVQPPPPTTSSVEYAPLKRAPGRSRLNNHVSSGVPVGDSTFLCEVCNKVFPLQRLLNRHMKCHSATKRYSCAFCGKGFNDTFDLKRHVRTHTGVRPYKCEKCGKAFTQRCSLESHLSKVHGEQHRYSYKQRRSKIFVCEECGITTETADNHYEHIKNKHPDSTELRKYQDKLQFQKLVMQQEAAAAAGGEGAVEFPRSRPDLSPTSEIMLYREHDEAALPLQNRAEQQRRMSEMRSPEELSPASSGSSGSCE